MQRAGQAPAHSSQPMHFSIPSGYRLRTWRPWKRCGLARISFGYSVVTMSLPRIPREKSLPVTRRPLQISSMTPTRSTPGKSELANADQHGRHHQPQQCSRDESLPTERHELVVAKTRESGADPKEHEDQNVGLHEEPDGWQDRRDETRQRAFPGGSVPATQEQGGGQGAHRKDVDVFGQEEHGETHPRVLGVKATHQLLFGLDQIEGCSVGLGEDGEKENDESHHLRKQVPTRDELGHHGDAREDVGESTSLTIDHFRQRQSGSVP